MIKLYIYVLNYKLIIMFYNLVGLKDHKIFYNKYMMNIDLK